MKKKKIFVRVVSLVKPHLLKIIVSIILAAVNVFTALIIPVLTGKAIDEMIGAGKVNFEAVKGILVYFLVALLVNALSVFLMTLLNNKVSFLVVRDLRSRLFEKLHKTPVRVLDSYGQGDLLSRVVSDVERVSEGLLLGFTELFTGVLTILATLVFMFVINPLIAVVVIVLTPLSLFAATFIAKKTYIHFERKASLLGKLTTKTNESINGAGVIKAFGAGDATKKDFDELNNEYTDANLKAVFFSSTTNPVTRFVNGVVYAAVAIIGAIFAIGGGISIGTLTCFLSYANQYTKPFNEISSVFTEFQNALACAGRIFEILDEEDSVDVIEKEGVSITGKKEFLGAVAVDDLSFSYDKTKKLLYDLNLSVKPGSHVAIVGPTGCGKTTFINLLLRFYEPDKGTISFDGVPSFAIHKSDLRRNIGMVLQDTWLKEGTVFENIAYGKEDATLDEVKEAAKRAYAYSFIERLEDGYNTKLLPDGGNLSAGQKQLLCIARLMLINPPILILDEATSSIDTRTEAKINRAFENLMEGKTCFIVAHRLSTIKNADLILVMKDGNIIEQGNHEELMNQRGFYRTMIEEG